MVELLAAPVPLVVTHAARPPHDEHATLADVVARSRTEPIGNLARYVRHHRRSQSARVATRAESAHREICCGGLDRRDRRRSQTLTAVAVSEAASAADTALLRGVPACAGPRRAISRNSLRALSIPSESARPAPIRVEPPNFDVEREVEVLAADANSRRRSAEGIIRAAPTSCGRCGNDRLRTAREV